MIQRIQSLYLFLITVLSVLTLVFPAASFIDSSKNLLYIMDIHGVSLVQANGQLLLQNTTSILTAFAAVFGIVSAVTLFSYKHRIKQIRLSVMNFIFMLGYYFLFFYFVWTQSNNLSADFHLKAGAVFPMVAAIFNYLAIGAIGKDEKLVKSLDRLR